MDIKFIKTADGACFVDITATTATDPTGRYNLPAGAGYNCDVAANKHTIMAPNLPGGKLRFLTTEINTGSSSPALVGSGTAALYSEINNRFFSKASSGVSSGGGLPSSFVFLSQAGIPSDADIDNGTVEGTDATTALNSLFASGGDFVWDTRTSHTGLLLGDNVRIYIPRGCGMLLRSGSNKPVLQNAGSDVTAVQNEHIYLYGAGIINGNGYNLAGDLSQRQLFSTLATGYNVGISFNGVRHFSVKGLEVKNCITYAMLGTRCEYGTVSKNKFWGGGVNHVYQDGTDFFSSKDITIDSNFYDVGDDHFCIGSDVLSNYNDPNFHGTFYAGGSGDTENIKITNNYILGSCGVRLLSTTHKLKDIYIVGNKGIVDNYWLMADNFYYNSAAAEAAGPGYMENIVVRDNHIEVVDLYAPFSDFGLGHVNIGCNIEGFKFENNSRWNFTDDTRPTIIFQGPASIVSDVTISGYKAVDNSGNVIKHIDIIEGTVTDISIITPNVKVTGSDNNSILLHVTSGAMAPNVKIDGGIVKGLNNVLFDEGTVINIQSVGLRHELTTDTNATFKTSGTIADICLSNFYGFLPTEGTFTKKRGDAFEVGGLPTFVPPFVPGAPTAVVFSGAGNRVGLLTSSPYPIWAPGSSAVVGYGNYDKGNLTLDAADTGRVMMYVTAGKATGWLILTDDTTPKTSTAIANCMAVLVDDTGDVYYSEGGVTQPNLGNIASYLPCWVGVQKTGGVGSGVLQRSPNAAAGSWVALRFYTNTITAPAVIQTDMYYANPSAYGDVRQPQAEGFHT